MFVLCSAGKISTAGQPPKLKVLSSGRQDTFNSTLCGYKVCREYVCGRLDRAVACGSEQERGHVLCVHILTVMPLPCHGCNEATGVCIGEGPLLLPQLVPSDQVAVCRATISPPSETKYLNVVCSQQPGVDAKWVDGAKPLFKVRIHLDSTIYTQVSGALCS